MANIVFSIGSGLNNSIYGNSQAPIQAMIEKRAEAFEQESIADKIFVAADSTNWGEKVTTMTAIDGFVPVAEGGEYPLAGMQEGHSKFIEHVTWKNSFVVTEEMIEDNKILDLKGRPEAFTAAFFRTKEQFAAALLAGAMKGDKTIDFAKRRFDVTCADGLPLFDANHMSAIADVKLKQTNKFKEAFSVDTLGAMESAMQDFRGDKEEVLAVSPDTIIIPNEHALKKSVFEAIGADKDPATANNGFNYQFGRWNVIVWQYLNQFLAKGTKPWVLLDSRYNEFNRGAIWYNRVPLSVKSIVDTKTDNNIWKGRARFSAGFNDWRAFAIGGISGGSALPS